MTYNQNTAFVLDMSITFYSPIIYFLITILRRDVKIQINIDIKQHISIKQLEYIKKYQNTPDPLCLLMVSPPQMPVPLKHMQTASIPQADFTIFRPMLHIV